jgi:hypothetical protein
MKRIAFLVCGLLLIVTNTAEARRSRWSNTTYVQPTQTAYTAYRPVAATTQTTAEQTASPTAEGAEDEATSAEATSAPATTAQPTTVPATPATYSTATAQGVANLMASYNRVGHFGGNPGYEGCGCGATPAAAYAICCYGNSGMTTVDVGYARSANGMWYCCRRYR